MKQFAGPISVLAVVILIVITSGCAAPHPSGSPVERPAVTVTPVAPVPAASSATADLPMRTIGIIGGMSWYSTQDYYRIINAEVQKERGGLHSAKILMYSEDFQEIHDLQTQGRWDLLTQIMIRDARRLENGGADVIVIATNTMHKTADDVQANIHIPLLNIIDVTGRAVQKKGMKKVALLGTKYTMEQDFYKGRLEKNFNLTVVVPDAEEQDFINSVIFDEISKGIQKPSSKARIQQIIERMKNEDGVEGVILGCTELPILIKQEDVDIHVFDTTRLHAMAAAKFALNRTTGDSA